MVRRWYDDDATMIQAALPPPEPFALLWHMARHERLQKAAWQAAADRERAQEDAQQRESGVITRKRGLQQEAEATRDFFASAERAAVSASRAALQQAAQTEAAPTTTQKNIPEQRPAPLCWALDAADAWAEISSERESSRERSNSTRKPSPSALQGPYIFSRDSLLQPNHQLKRNRRRARRLR